MSEDPMLYCDGQPIAKVVGPVSTRYYLRMALRSDQLSQCARYGTIAVLRGHLSEPVRRLLEDPA